ncbi:hypothetical protein I4U23_014162 [Adineta vaga]|nr:hypothetical protein I4U23_014162 [Adineta vaga]
MLYMPATTLAAPIVLQGTQTVPLPLATRYYMVQPTTTTTTTTTLLPTVPLLNTALVYPRYGLVTNLVENDNKEKAQLQGVIQHVVHHYPPPSYCELCCQCDENSSERRSRSRSRSRSPSPSTREQTRHSRRDEYNLSVYDTKIEAINEKIEKLRRELDLAPVSKQHQATETVDYYHPPPKPRPPPVEESTQYKQHYDAPKPRPRSSSRSRSRSRPRSASSLPREPWRSSNQNEYPWRDAHLPAYREATLARAQTPVNETQTWNETTQERSHSVTRSRCVSPCHTITDYNCRPSTVVDYTCRPSSSTVVSNYGPQVYNYTTPSTSCCDHSFYSDIPTTTKTHHLRKIDSTPSHNVYGCNDPCLHVVPKQGSASDPPYLKIHNAPVTYLH